MTSRGTAGFVLLLLAGSVASVLAAPPEPPGIKLNGDAQRGRTEYMQRCALCHGEKGDGRGKLAATLNPKPADFATPGLLARRSDWELYLVVRDGGPAIGLSPKMLPWGKLMTDQQIRDAAAYVRSLAK
ncbi:MAG TPA: cytochrome c [Thermoanaerobaculia bacterium]|nr:cytochrome c [Thermoanaerobaculia bacterium]